MPASFWDITNWYNWYMWPAFQKDDMAVPEEEETLTAEDKIEPKADKTITFADMDSIDDQIIPKIEAKIVMEKTPKQEAPIKEKQIKPKRKRKTAQKPEQVSLENGIQIILRPNILEELEKEAQGIDTTLNQLIQIILEAHVETKDESSIQTEPWECTFCNPTEHFDDYFKFSEHFFENHMRPDLDKLNENKQSNLASEAN